ncbi:MAG: DsbA family protein [Rhodobacteraceae bacterium]|nr:DsbA family protein [Paracoccaceae bacterium]
MINRFLQISHNVILLFAFLMATAITSVTAQENQPQRVIEEMSIGNQDSNVTFVEYASFTCPHCASFHRNSYPQLKENYIDTGLIKFEIREVIWDKPAWVASIIGRCSGPEKFFHYLDPLYEKQSEWSRAQTLGEAASRLTSIALSVGFDKEEIDSCLRDTDFHSLILQNAEDSAAANDISSTPTFRINDRNYSNTSYEELVEIIENLLNRT